MNPIYFKRYDLNVIKLFPVCKEKLHLLDYKKGNRFFQNKR